MKKDNIYAKPIDKVSDFEFNEQVSSVFDNMINNNCLEKEKLNEILTKFSIIKCDNLTN